MGAFLQGLGDQLATAAALLTRIVGVRQHDVPPGACSLGGTEGLELSPASVKNRCVEASLGAGSIGQIHVCPLRVSLGFGYFAHVGDLQVFKDHHAKTVDQCPGCFVLEVPPLIAHRLCAWPGRARPASVDGSHAFCGPWLLQEFRWLLPLAVVARVPDGFPGGHCGKVQQAQVQPAASSLGRQGSSSTSQEKVTYQWSASRLMVQVLTCPTTGRCRRTFMSPILERVRRFPARAKPAWGKVKES